MDLREKFTNELSTQLIKKFDSDVVSEIMHSVITQLEDYEIILKSTEIAVVDNDSQQAMELYAGSLLTEGKSKGTVKSYIYVLKRFLHDIDKSLLKVSTFDIKIWLAKQQQVVSLRTCDNYRSYLSAFYTWLANEDYIEKNPMAKIKPIKFVRHVEKKFSDVEIDALRLSCKIIRDRSIIEFLLSSGVRIAELCDMMIEDINFEKNSVFVRDGKGGKSRTTFINDIAASYLKKYLQSRNDDYGYLFLTRNQTPLTPDTTRTMLKKLGAKAGVDNVHPHRFRRTFATMMHKKGMDIHTIQKLMGHTDINTTMIYISDDDEAINTEYKKYA